MVVSSSIVSAKGRKIEVREGRTFELIGDPHQEYAMIIQESGKTIDMDNPLKGDL